MNRIVGERDGLRRAHVVKSNPDIASIKGRGSEIRSTAAVQWPGDERTRPVSLPNNRPTKIEPKLLHSKELMKKINAIIHHMMNVKDCKICQEAI